jgi:amino acid transporter
MGPTGMFIEFLEAIGFFTFLAYLLVFIVLFYLFKEGLERGVKRIKSTEKRRWIAGIASILVTALLYLLLAPFASVAASYVAVAIFVLLFIFIVVAAAAKIMGIDILGLIR